MPEMPKIPGARPGDDVAKKSVDAVGADRTIRIPGTEKA